MSNALSVQNITFHRKGRLVLDRVSLAVPRASTIALLGTNGAGKSTLFDIICGLRSPDEGQVFGASTQDRTAYLTQVITIPDALRLGELAQLIHRLSLTDKRRLAAVLEISPPRASEKFRMLWMRRANSCSYGEKRWFSLMVVLSLDADLYILDEPTAGIDPEYRYYVWEVLANIKRQGKSILFSTHLIAEVESQCDGFYFLHDGTARHFSTAEQLLHTCKATSLDEAFVKYVTT